MMKQILFLTGLLLLFLMSSKQSNGQVEKSDWEGGFPEGCTSITCGKDATEDGSVITSHTDDSHRTRSSVMIEPPRQHTKGSTMTMYKRTYCDTTIMPSYAHVPIGSIPQVSETYGFINSAYPCLNQYQLAIGESTFGGRDTLQSDAGLIDCQRLCRIMLERCKTAREAIQLAGVLLKKYGWNDAGECLTIADKNEVWHFEVVGPGRGKIGAVWVAQRVPDGHVSVNANASTIKEINIKDKDMFMASENIYDVAEQNGWWQKGETFRFCYAYAPKSRTSIAARRREWRVFDLLAPSLKLDPNAENYPFSVKPDNPVSLKMLVDVFKDYYEATPFDMTKNLTVEDENGNCIISPLANPFMPYDMNKLLKINGGWDWRGERTIARWYTMYATIIQLRSWMPDEIGGVAWFALDNVANSIYIPMYSGITDLPDTYKTCGRKTGYSHKSAWWAFNRLGTLSAQRWGDMRKDLDSVWIPMQTTLFEDQKKIEQEAMNIYEKDKEALKVFLTDYTNMWGEKVVKQAWILGDHLWTQYDEKF